MITNKENPAPIHETAAEEEALLKKSSAPTLRDLRAAAKDRFTTIEAEPDSTSPNEGLPQQAHMADDIDVAKASDRRVDRQRLLVLRLVHPVRPDVQLDPVGVPGGSWTDRRDACITDKHRAQVALIPFEVRVRSRP